MSYLWIERKKKQRKEDSTKNTSTSFVLNCFGNVCSFLNYSFRVVSVFVFQVLSRCFLFLQVYKRKKKKKNELLPNPTDKTYMYTSYYTMKNGSKGVHPKTKKERKKKKKKMRKWT